jgi:hypothetical protein
MTTSYPGALDSFTNPTSTDALNSSTVPHATQHTNLNDAVLAIETELGTTPKGTYASVKARLDAINPAAGQVQGTSRGFFGASALAQTAVSTNPMVVAKDSGATFVQIAAINASSTGSADFAAYGDNGTDATGWVDVGFTGSAFSDSAYTITNPNDGYLFSSATSSGFTGNLVLATSGNGSANDIVFATGGFLTANEKARMNGSTGKLTVKSLATAAGTTTLAPLQFTAGTNLTTPVSGSVEFDGTASYLTTTSGRSAIETELFATTGSFIAPLKQVASAAVTPIFGGYVSANATLGTPTGTGPWTVVVTGLTGTGGFRVGTTVTATAGTGSFNTNTVTIVSIDSATQMTVSATGGTIPTAGTVTAFTNATTGALTLANNTMYTFEIWMPNITQTVSTTKTISITGTATYSSFAMQGWSVSAAANSATANTVTTWNTSTSIVIISTSATTTVSSLIKGYFKTSAAGTFIPNIAFTGTTPAAGSLGAGTYIKVFPIGTGTAATYIGAWA